MRQPSAYTVKKLTEDAETVVDEILDEQSTEADFWQPSRKARR
ncbi:hypothetical protein [Haloarcula sp. CBA1127]|nr:hypothetical protein [Haloarcula sp. CBA1127]